MLAVFRKDVRVLLRDRCALVFSLLMPILVITVSALGGLWWPQSVQPDWMNRVSPMVFTTWSMRGLNDLILREAGLQAVLLPAGVPLAYGTAMLAVGLHLFRVRHSVR